MPIFELGPANPFKSRVKIWFGLVEPFKSYRVHKHFSGGGGGGGQKPPLEGVTFDL